MNERLNKLFNLERIVIDNIHLDIANVEMKIVNLKSFIFRLKAKELKDKNIKDKIDENIKEIENIMNDLGIDYKEKIKNNNHYCGIIKDILNKLFYYKNVTLSKYVFYKRLDAAGVDENIKYLINYIVALDTSIFDEKDRAEEIIKYVKKEAEEIDIAIKKLDLGE